MNKPLSYLILFLNIIFFNIGHSQETLQIEDSNLVHKIFQEEEPLPITLSFDIKDIKKNTNDSTYVNTTLAYKLKDSTEHALEIMIRRRGNYRLKKCYFPPITVKFNKKEVKKTAFKGHKKLKLVMPCLLQKDNNDNVIKEYLAYKLFESISPYHFKTRLVDLTFDEIKGQKIKTHNIKGILIEDDKSVANRFNGKVYKRYSHPLNHEPVASVKNTLFQFMIGNTDFSQAYLHNVKVVYIDNNMIPLPYDFDMSGFVNCSYAVVSQIQGESLGITSVKDRLYRGFVRDESVFYQVRNEFLDKKNDMLSILDKNETYFSDPREFEISKSYILGFFDIMINDKKFKSQIIDSARKE